MCNQIFRQLLASRSTCCNPTSSYFFACALCFVLCFLLVPVEAQEKPTSVQVERVIQRRVSIEQTFVGTAMPPRRSIIGSAVDGRIVQMFVREGDAVQATQPLMQLRTGTLEIELASAQAELEFYNQKLAELNNGSRPEEIERSKALVAGAKARADYSDANLQRVRRTYGKGAVVTLDELEEALSYAVAARQELLAAKAEYQMVQQGPRHEQIAQAVARLAVQNELVRQIEDRLALHTLKAPFDGYVTKRHNEVGGWTKAGEEVVEIVELNPIEVEVFVLEDFVVHVLPGAPGTVVFDAFKKKTFQSQVVQVVPQADLRSRTFPVKVQLQNPIENNQPLIKAGMFARVTLSCEIPQEVLMVPKDSLVLNGDQRVLYVVQPATDQDEVTRVAAISVELGVSDGRWIEVLGDVSAGQLVVVKGNERLRSKQAVSIAK